MAELLQFKMCYGRPHLLVRWAGSDVSGNTWKLLDNLTTCEEAIAAFEQAPSTCRRRCRPAATLPPGRLHHRRCAARGPGRASRGADAALLVA